MIELLIVIAIVAILAVVVVLTLNPAQQLKQSRDSQRLSELATLTKAISAFQADQSGTSLGSASTTYVSVPDSDSGCANLGLPPQPAGWTYRCATTANYRKTDGTGWIPLNFTSVTFRSPLGQLPIDPINTTSTGYYYAYVTNGSQFLLTGIPESQKQHTNLTTAPVISNSPGVFAQGSKLDLQNIYSPPGLLGYWNMDEGSGSTALDRSGGGSNGTWAGTGSYYTSAAKAGGYAGFFNGSNGTLAVSNAAPAGQFNWNGGGTLAFWVYFNSVAVNTRLLSTADAGMTSGWTIYVRTSNYFEIQQIFNTAAMRFQNTNFIISPGTWIHVAITYDSSAAGNSPTFYINGAALGTQSNQGGSGTRVDSSGSLYMGSLAGGSNYLTGYLDDVRIYNRILSAAEILAIYNATK